MINSLAKGKYIVAVSGGVDSIALLHSLHQLAKHQGSEIELVVAHFDHGIRPNSNLDAEHVQKLATSLGLKYEVGSANLGPDASEELARKTRYNFLKVAKAKHSAKSIITAHHQDDMLETAIINISRGTGRHGLSSLKSEPDLLRPLLHLPKTEVVKYAVDNQLLWREDSTNLDTKYLRNHVRANVVPKLSVEQKVKLVKLIESVGHLNIEADKHMETYVTYKSFRRSNVVYPRRWFNQLPHDLACSVVHHWLRRMDIKDYSRSQIEKLVINLKTGKPGKLFDIDGAHKIELTKRSIRLPLASQTSRMVVHEAKKQ